MRRSEAAALVSPDDKRLRLSSPAILGASGPLRTYFAEPSAPRGKAPAVLVIHESRGRTTYIEDVVRRLAVAGYAALAPDFLSSQGGTPGDADKARMMTGDLDTDQATADAVASLVWLAGRPQAGKTAALGFAWGAGIVGRLACVAPILSGAVMFYGKPPPAKDAARIRTPLQLHYAELDQKTLEAVPDFRAALQSAAVPVEEYRYAGTAASFHDDTAGGRFNAEAAQLAWERSLAFLKAKLG